MLVAGLRRGNGRVRDRGGHKVLPTRPEPRRGVQGREGQDDQVPLVQIQRTAVFIQGINGVKAQGPHEEPFSGKAGWMPQVGSWRAYFKS